MTKYILSKRYSLVDNIEGLDAENDHEQKYIIDLKGHFFTIPPLMFDLLELFKEPIALVDACNLVIQKLADDNERAKGLKVVRKFIQSLIEKKMLITEEKANDFKLYVKSFSKEDEIGEYQVEKTIKNKFDFNILKARHKTTNEIVLIKHYDLKNNTKKKRLHSLLEQEYNHHLRISKFVKSTPKLINFVSNENEVYIVMEFLSDTSAIKTLLESNLSVAQKIKIIIGCISVINEIHIKGFIHGDIHLGNFMVTENFDVYLIDFGLTNNLNNDNDKIKHSGGVYQFLPPERILNNPLQKFALYHDYKSEMYQLGVLSYFILYEKFPYSADTWKAFHKQVLDTDPHFEDSIQKQKIPIEIILVLENLLQKDIDLRPRSLTIVLERMENYNVVNAI